MRHILPSANTSWLLGLTDVISRGEVVSPRGKNTREIIGYRSSFEMSNPIITEPKRKLGYKFMAAEAAWILSGDNRVSSIRPFSKHIENFSDDGVTFFGAYGPKVVDQLQYVVQSLVDDPDSRQAVLTIWRPSPRKSKDIPCTVSVQWFIRDGYLHCVNFMRSSDLWLGHPYDVFNFTMVSLAVLLRLREFGVSVKLGSMDLFAGSKHIYEPNWDEVHDLIKSSSGYDMAEKLIVNPEIFHNEDHLVESLWLAARSNHGALDPILWVG